MWKMNFLEGMSNFFKTLAFLVLFGAGQQAMAQNFITHWDLSIPGSGNDQISIGTATSGNVNYTWQQLPTGATGSGSWSGATLLITGLPPDATIRLEITPANFQRININNGSDRSKLILIENWGSTAWTSMQRAFRGCENLQITATDTPNLSGVFNMGEMFSGCSSLNSPNNINTWNTSAVTFMGSMFSGALAFDQNIGSWNTAAVTNMSSMFIGASAFNQNIGAWNTGAVTNMNGMFYQASSFNQNIGAWNTTAVTNMTQMFYQASSFDQNIGAWNTGAVTNMREMFNQASAFNQNIGTWNTGAVTDMSRMFLMVVNFNQNIGTWNTAAVTNMSYMFAGAFAFNNGGSNSINNWNTTALTNMSGMFSDASAFNQNIGSWNTGSVTNMSYSFKGASAFNQNIGTWNTAAVTNMLGMFNGATAFNQNIGAWNTGAVTDMQIMFWNASAFNQNIGGWNTGSVIDMNTMFSGATAFNQNLGAWTLNPVVNLYDMLFSCGMDCNNYSATLIGWNANSSTPDNVTLGAIGRQYGTNAVAARTNLTTTKGWTITGDTPSGSSCVVNNNFVTIWNLATAGSGANQLSFGTATSGTVNYTWQEISPGSATGSGTWSGTTLSIAGLPTGATIRLQIAPTNFQRFVIDRGADRNRITQVEQWGSVVWTSMLRAFDGCSNIQVTAIDVPNLSNVTDMENMFRGCTNLNSPSNINTWNTATITKMSGLFEQASAFNQNIGSWNTGAVTQMIFTFHGASAFNQNIGSWNTGAVTNMSEMFRGAIAFNQNIGSWNTSAVVDMRSMFAQATSFNQNIGSWNISAVVDTRGMFWQASAFNQNISSWNTTAVTDMFFMFWGASSFNQDISSWNTAAVTIMGGMFEQATAFNQNLGAWTLNPAVSLSNMLNNSGMDCNNYSATLIGWSANPTTPINRSLGAVGRQYGTNADAARTNLTVTKGWTITGDSPSGTVCGSVTCVSALQRAALIELYNTTDGANWTDNANWLTPDESTWFGVTVTGCSITGLSLPSNNLNGYLPAEMGDLTDLTLLDFSDNYLYEGLPPELSNLTDLQYLYVQGNQLQYDIPSELSNLSSLIEASLGSNRFTGTAPAIGLASMGMSDVSLESNFLIGLNDITGYYNLTSFSIGGNQLTFEDLEPNASVSGFTYSPQAKLPPGGIISYQVGGSLTIPFTTAGTANSYQWYKNNVLIPGATSATFSIPSSTIADEGTYYVLVDNSIATGVTLQSLDYVVIADPCTSGIRTSGLIDSGFNPAFDTPANLPGVALQSSGKIIVAVANNNTVGGIPVYGTIRFNTDGTLDNTFNQIPEITIPLIQPDDKILGYANDQMVRYNPDGTDDFTFNSNAPQSYSSSLYAMALQPDGKIVYSVEAYMGTQELSRLNSDGTPDTSFPPISILASALEVQSNGKILVGSTSGFLSRLNADGSTDFSFNAGFNTIQSISDLLVQPDGKIIMVGKFTSIQGSNRFGIVRLNNDGSIDPSFIAQGISDLTTLGGPNRVALMSNGQLIVAGDFITVNGSQKKNLVRLNSDGTVDCSFDPGLSTDIAITSIAIQPDNKILISGGFTLYDGTLRNGLARVNNGAPTSCLPASERAALVALYNSTGGASWTNKTNWLNGDEGTWFGVTVTGCNVTGIVLENNNLINSIPTEIGDLTGLAELNLSHNQLNGSLPPTLPNCAALEIIDLEDNLLSGTIPIYFNTFNNLYSINLGFNQFSGSIPSQLGNIPPLEFLSLANNQLTGSIPTTLGSLINLTLLDLSRNQLSGSIPTSLGTLPLLTSLQLWQNQLTGAIPTELGNITNLQYLNLSDNQFTGSIPTSLGSISGLLSLELQQNQLSGTIPNLGSTALVVLKLSDNMITGPIPASLSNLTGLVQLDLDRNQLTGILPPELKDLTLLEDFNVYNNQLSGSLPTEYTSLIRLLRFRINDNTISGSVPSGYLSWNDIEILNLGNNLLDGIPTFTAPGITELNVDNNNLEFGDLEPNISVQGFTYSPQADLPGGMISVQLGTPLSIPFTTSGTANEYQWYKDGVLIPGAISTTFSVASAALSDAGNYTIAITSPIVTGLILNSLPFEVTVPLITVITQPLDVAVCDGSVGTFSCFATGANNITYQWQYSPTGPAFSDIVNGSNYSGATTATLSVNTSGSFGAGRYRCRINGDLTTQVITTDGGLFINPIPIAPTATGSSSCGTGVVTLTASGATNGEYRWYTLASGGTAITGEVNSTYTTPSISSTTTYFVSRNDGNCESTRTPVVATINTPPSSPTTTGGSLCATGVVTLTASGAANGDYRWYTLASGGTAIAGEVNDTYITPSISTTTTYYVSVNDGTCESTRTAVVAAINTPPTAPTTTDGSSCGTSAVMLTASGATNGEYRWYDVASGGTAITGEVNSSFITTSISTTTTYYVSVNIGACESTRTAVVATINSIVTPPTTTGSSSCGTGAVVLTASGGTNGEYRWYDIATGGTAITGEVNNSFTTASISSTTTYFVSINTGACESSRTAVVATINSTLTPPTTTGSSVCGTGSVSITAAGATNGEYRWYDVATGGTALSGEVNSSFTTPSISTTTTYYVAINNGACESLRSPAVATINSVPAKPLITTSGSTTLCTGQSVTLSAPVGFTYSWSTGATSQQIIVSTAGSFTVQVASGGCTSALSDPVVVSIGVCNQPPVIAATTVQAGVEGSVTVPITGLLSDPDNNLDLSTLRITQQPTSGAPASINSNNELIIDYQGLSFAGTDELTIEVCDLSGECVQQKITIEVVGDIIVYNAISPNDDNKHPTFYLKYIEAIEETQKNKVSIFNRWGDLVWEGVNYNNTSVVFTGLNKNGNELPTGTYFYKIEYASGRKTDSGYLSLKR